MEEKNASYRLQNMNKARLARLEKIHSKKDEDDLKRLSQLQLKKLQLLKMAPIEEPTKNTKSKSKPKIVIQESETDSDESMSESSDEEIIYAPIKKRKCKTVVKGRGQKLDNAEVEELKKQIQELKLMNKPNHIGSSSPMSSEVTSTKPPPASDIDNNLKLYMRNRILGNF